MNWEQIEGKWKQFRGEVRSRWGKLTDDDLEQVKGSRDILIGKLEERYGYSKERAEQEVREWSDALRS